MKKLFFLTFIVFSIISCVDPLCVLYEVNVKMKNVPENDCGYICAIKDYDETLLIASVLEKEKKYFSSFKNAGMGPQYDFKKPDEQLRKVLDKIENGNTFSVVEENKNGEKKKFTLSYTSSDVVDITTNDSMYRKYVILLDYNKLVPVVE